MFPYYNTRTYYNLPKCWTKVDFPLHSFPSYRQLFSCTAAILKKYDVTLRTVHVPHELYGDLAHA